MGFNSLNIAKSGLVASQMALDVTSNNIANANTKGYTRQRLDLSAKAGTNNGIVSPGNGVEIENLTQIRNEYLDLQFRSENSVNSELLSKSLAMGKIENIFAEPSEYGINENLSNFFTALEEMSYNAHDLSYRETVVQMAVTLTDSFHTIANELVNYQKELDNNISMTVDDINTKIEEIQALNETIYNFELKGTTANELRDKRNLVVDELSQLIDIDTFETAEGKYMVNSSGTSLVNDTSINKLEVKQEGTDPVTGNKSSALYWQGTTSEVKPQGGVIKGYLDIRDGSTQDKQGVPYYLSQLNDMAVAMVESFNKINNDGFTVPYEGSPSSDNVNFFDTENVSAIDIAVSEELLESGWNIAMSGMKLDGEMNWGNSVNGQSLLDLRDGSGMKTGDTLIGNLEEFYQKTISEMAINANYTSSRSSSQQELTDFIEGQRLAVSEVSLDEEMINMVQYQQSYNASAKMITVINDMLTTLINMVR
jgi:flagellar hook-associated protein 1 FlgK